MNIKSAFRSLHVLQWLAFWVAAAAANPAFAAPDNQGREFVLGFMQNYEGLGKGDGNIKLYLTAPQPTTVTVQGHGFGPETYPVKSDTITAVTLPVNLRASGSGTIENKGLVLSAPDEFIVYGLNQITTSTDAFLGLPTDVAGTEFIVPSFSNAKKTLPSELLIVAQEDGTEVEFSPRSKTIGGEDVASVKARKSVLFSLNRLQIIQFQAKGGTAADLTGSVITSNKAISVFSGHLCGVVPRIASACDHMVEQIPSTNTWGTAFLTTPLATRKKGDIFRILAANDETTVEIDGKRIAKLKRGAFKQVDLASDSFHQINTSGPALVAQYSKSTSTDRVDSDPFMMLIPPTEQFGSDYLVSTPAGDPVSFNNYLNIVAPSDKLAGLLLDDKAIAAPFSAIGSSGFSGTRVPVAIGTHTVKHLLANVPLGIYSYGFAPSDSYGYSGGSRLANITETCASTETEPGDGIDNDCDHRIDEELLNRSDDDGDGKIDEDLAKEIIPTSANAGGPYVVDEGGSIVLNGSATGEASAFAWDLDNDGSFETTGATPMFAGTDGPATHKATLRVTGAGGDSDAEATITVNNIAPTVAAGGNANLKDGAAFSQAGTFTDPGADTWNATVDYGDGSGVQPLALDGKQFNLNHRYAGNGPYTVTVTVGDDDGESGSDSLQVNINNTAPTVNAGVDAAITEGSSFTQSGAFTDPGVDAWTATVDYGDGSGAQTLTLNGKNFSLDHVYADNGLYSVTVTVNDDKGGSGSDSLQVSVGNAAPATAAGADARLNEGSVFTQSGAFIDPGLDTWSATVDYGDGSGVQNLPLTGKNFSLDHAYADNGLYTVTVSISDNNGGTGSDTVQVSVDNVAPTVDAGKSTTINESPEGALFEQAGAFIDPGLDTWSATVDYGDDSGAQPLALNGKTFTLNHVYSGDGVYTVTVTVADDDGASHSDSVQVSLNNQAPAVVAGTNATINEGSAFNQLGDFTDPSAGPWSATVDYGDGSDIQPLILSGKSFTLDHVYGDDGIYSVTVTVTDNNGGVGSDTVQVTVNNVLPIVDAGKDATLNPGAPFSQTGAFSDPGADVWTATVDYGDDTGVQPLVLNGKSFNLNHAYTGNGPYTITVTVRDDNGGVGSDSVQIGINNIAPTVNAGADATLNEGSAFSQTGSFTDPNADVWTATVDYGDGSGVQPLVLSSKNFSLDHIYADNGLYTVTVSVADNHGGVSSDSVQVTVDNVAPTVDAGKDAALNPSAPFSQAGIFSDPGADVWTATVDYGDGSGVQPLALSGKSFSLNHAYTGNGPYTITVTVRDNNGGIGSDSVQIGINNIAPTVDAGKDAVLNEGSAFSQAGAFTDPNADAWTATVDYGDGSGVQPLVLSGKNFSLDHVYADNGLYAVTVSVSDNHGGVGSDSVQVTVNNVAPTVDAGLDATLNPGAPFSQTGTISDPGADVWTATVDYGDDTGIQPLLLSGKSFSLNHAYTGNGPYTITITVRDDDRGSGSDSVQISINNLAPTVNAGADATLTEGSTFSQTGSFTDPNADVWTASVDYGDGSGVQTLTLSGKNFSLDHVYADNGLYSVTVTVNDDKGGVGSDGMQVAVDNVVPTVDAGKDIIVNEGTAFSQSGAFTDPGVGPWSATVDYGDGSGGQPLVLSGKSFTLDHAYGDNGVYTITVTVVDNNGGAGSDTVQVTVNNVAPTVDAGKDALLDGNSDGTLFVQTGSFSDPGADNWTATVDYGDDSSPVPLDLNGKNFTLNHIYFGSGIYNVTVTVDDQDGGIGSDTVQVTFNNAPIVSAGPDATLNEGSTFSQAGSFRDPDSSVWSATVDYGDGSGVHDLALDGTSFALDHAYLNNGTYTVTVAVTDDSGNVGSDTVQIQVFNVAPRVAAINTIQSSLCDPFIADGSFVDPGADVWTATVNYGDNTGDQPLTLNGKTFTLRHAFAPSTSPIFDVTVTVNDGDTNGSNTVTIQCGFFSP